MIRRLLVGGVTLLIAVFAFPLHADALSSSSKQFISADNTFYAYVKGGESISAAFTRVNQDEPFDTVRGDVTVTLDGPEFATKTCVIPKDVAVGKGCTFAPQVATKSGIWRIQFAVPATARSYKEVAPDVRWAKNLFSWSVDVSGADGEEQGRVWTERYAIRQPVASSYLDDFVTHYISEDGYIYKAVNTGYNGQISTLSADSIGIRKGTECVSAYQSADVNSTTLSPALGTCGNAYKLFFEEPSGDLPPKANRWDDTSDWIRPNINRPSIAELHFTSDKSTDQLSGTISFFLRNFIGQYKIKIDVDNDGSFDGQSDVVMNEQMKKLSSGLQQIRFAGVDKDGQVIPISQKIGIKVEITKVAEIHLVATDVEGRTGGIELVRLNGDNAPTTKICWNDSELTPLADITLMTSKLDGRDCPDSIGGVHRWAYADASWGNARYIDDWAYASAKLLGNNKIVYPEDTAAASGIVQRNWLVIVLAIVGSLVVVGGIVAAVVIRRKKNRELQQIVPPAPLPSTDTTVSGQPIDNNDRY